MKTIYNTHAPEIERGLRVLKQALLTIPESPGIYEMLGQDQKILYIGKAKNLKKRVSNYTRVNALPGRLLRMLAHLFSVQTTITDNELEALLLEMNLIKKKLPPYNILLKDGKSPFFLVVTQHPFPRLVKERRVDRQKTQAYFGPFISSQTVNTTLDVLHKAFLLRSCSDHTFNQRTRPCLLYHIKKCSAPCVQKISLEEYQKNVAQTVELLKGKKSELQRSLMTQMQQASQQQEYEKAAELRDRLRALAAIQNEQTIYSQVLQDADVIVAAFQQDVTCIQVVCFRSSAHYGGQHFFFPGTAQEDQEEVLSSFMQQFYTKIEPPAELILQTPIASEGLLKSAFQKLYDLKVQFSYPKKGEKQLILERTMTNAQHNLQQYFSQKNQELKMREALQERFILPQLPLQIEVYDNSHWQGQQGVGAMIVAGPSGFMRKYFRSFSLEDNGGDDHKLLRYALTKRFSDDVIPQPDLIIIDGGKGQLSTAIRILESLGKHQIPVVGMAKGPVHKDGGETFYFSDGRSLQLEDSDPLLHFLQRLRNHAHQFAIQSHRRLRKKKFIRSQLEDIKGLGPGRRQALLCHFQDIKGIAAASVGELAKVPGISDKLAETIFAFFNA
ncbi:MAG: excinuclease ABC subunit C [Alphaproteobacteria bacterium 40-19]|nr:MAG: excinuclease ABC subunit C [Alphaproteobacteria bacterium 40-19]